MTYRQSSRNSARELLLSILSEEEWNRFNQAGVLEIAAKCGVNRLNVNGPTRLLDSGTRNVVATTHFQILPAGSARDRVIAEYLLIRNDENLYWQTVRITPEKSRSRLYLLLSIAAFDIALLVTLFAQFR